MLIFLNLAEYTKALLLFGLCPQRIWKSRRIASHLKSLDFSPFTDVAGLRKGEPEDTIVNGEANLQPFKLLLIH